MTVDLPRFSEPALCAETDPELFFPEPGAGSWSAKRVCRACLAQPECLAWAIKHDETFGVWGGMSTRERRRSVGLPARPPVAKPVEEAPGNRRPRRVLVESERQRIASLTALGWSAQQIAEDLDIHPRSVTRIRSEQRAARAAA